MDLVQRIFREDLQNAGLPAPIQEHQFAKAALMRKWALDYAWPEWLAALEVEGGIWRKGGGAHSHPSGIIRDIEKYNAATLLGWRIYRVIPGRLNEPAVVTHVERLLRLGGWSR